MPVYFLGAASTDSYKLSCFATLAAPVQEIIFHLYWATRNYMVHLRITNADKIFMMYA